MTQRNAAIWSTTDDEILLQARGSGLNWQPIANRHFPNKTANACRKRHERLIERRQVEDWDVQKLELLAREYVMVRREMWEMLASRVGEKWTTVEQKCMEKGLKGLQSAARTAQRRSSCAMDSGPSFDSERGISEQNSDSGIGLEGGHSDAEMDAGERRHHPAERSPPTATTMATGQHAKSASWHAHEAPCQHPRHTSLSMADHIRSRSLPQPLPLYQPPPPIVSATRRTFDGGEMTASPDDVVFPGPVGKSFTRYSPDSNGRGGISIQSVLSPSEPEYGGGGERRGYGY
ncbi:hypothetical protein LTR53_011206 [Teratosphaeriaceae sp. CCFEE 6253]|nr:hypothetical protein LTR53_011206 [Teratosphaeriaceae sp. CCFEE 6253]